MVAQLKDIAAYTGVSIKTVSNVINGNFARVSPQTRASVEAAVNKFHYRPNTAARHLRKAHVNVIALAIPDLSNPYFAEIGHAIIHAAADEHYTVLVDFTGGERQNESMAVNGLRPHLIDGIILDPQALEHEDISLEASRIPVVLLGERLFNTTCDHIVIDNVAAAVAATEHLLALGRRRIAIIGIQDESSTCIAPSLRQQGYLQELRRAGLTPRKEYQLTGGAWHREDGARAMYQLLQEEEPPDALFCCNDLLALGAMSVLHAQGYRIPQDIAVVGFDDIEEAQYAYPPLTSIRPDKIEIGQLAVKTLLERIRQLEGEPPASPHTFIVPFTLQARASTRG